VGYVRAPENVCRPTSIFWCQSWVDVDVEVELPWYCDWLIDCTHTDHIDHIVVFFCFVFCFVFVFDFVEQSLWPMHVVGFVCAPEMSDFVSGWYWHETVRDLYAKWFLSFCTWVEVEIEIEVAMHDNVVIDWKYTKITWGSHRSHSRFSLSCISVLTLLVLLRFDFGAKVCHRFQLARVMVHGTGSRNFDLCHGCTQSPGREWSPLFLQVGLVLFSLSCDAWYCDWLVVHTPITSITTMYLTVVTILNCLMRATFGIRQHFQVSRKLCDLLRGQFMITWTSSGKCLSRWVKLNLVFVHN
jgi:hypothetical protein